MSQQHKSTVLGFQVRVRMGAGIAYVSAQAGLKVVLKDTSLENAEKGKTIPVNYYKRY